MVIPDLILIIAATLTAYAISNVSMPAIIKIAELKNLINAPDNDHIPQKCNVPTLGGIGIFSAFIISYSIWGQALSMQEFPFFVAALFILFLMGVRDDILKLNALTKFIVQLAAVLILVYGGGVYLSSFGGIFGVEDVSWLTGSLSTVVIMLAVINAYNLIDKIDGLAGGIGVIVAGVFGIWFWGSGFLSYALLSFALSGALIGFLAFNMYPAKLSMGDTGAMSVGFILGFLAIEFIALNHTLTNQIWHVSNGEVLAVSILIVPVIEALRVTLMRLNKSISLFEVNKSFARQVILDMRITHHNAVFIVWLFNLLMIGLAYLTMPLNVNLQLGIVIGVGILILPAVRLVAYVGQKMFNIRIKETKTESAGAG